MNAALNEQMESVFMFLVSNVEVRVRVRYVLLITFNNSLQSPQTPCLRQTALSALTSYVEGVEWRLLLMVDCRLPRVLCALLAEEEVKIEVCECLLNILARKVGVAYIPGRKVGVFLGCVQVSCGIDFCS